MKTIIAGHRSCFDFSIVAKAVEESGFDITEVVSGTCKGVDQLGEAWAKQHGVPVKQFPAKWEIYRQGAGPIRNRQMAEYAEALIAILAPGSKGTANMIAQAKELGLKIFIKRI